MRVATELLLVVIAVVALVRGRPEWVRPYVASIAAAMALVVLIVFGLAATT